MDDTCTYFTKFRNGMVLMNLKLFATHKKGFEATTVINSWQITTRRSVHNEFIAHYAVCVLENNFCYLR